MFSLIQRGTRLLNSQGLCDLNKLLIELNVNRCERKPAINMRNKPRSVTIARLPEQSDNKGREDYRDLESCINVDRPAVVLDCSTLRFLDSSNLHLLLCCLEEAMKRNGDIRLAAVRPEALSVLHSAGVDFLFECFETISEAMDSYGRPPLKFVSSERADVGDHRSESNAA